MGGCTALVAGCRNEESYGAYQYVSKFLFGIGTAYLRFASENFIRKCKARLFEALVPKRNVQKMSEIASAIIKAASGSEAGGQCQ